MITESEREHLRELRDATVGYVDADADADAGYANDCGTRQAAIYASFIYGKASAIDGGRRVQTGLKGLSPCNHLQRKLGELK